MHNEAVKYIANNLSVTKQRILVLSLEGSDAEIIPIDDSIAHENAVRSLMRGAAPLAIDAGPFRYLTPLGAEVARYLADAHKELKFSIAQTG